MRGGGQRRRCPAAPPALAEQRRGRAAPPRPWARSRPAWHGRAWGGGGARAGEGRARGGAPRAARPRSCRRRHEAAPPSACQAAHGQASAAPAPTRPMQGPRAGVGGGQGRACTWPSNAASGGKPCAGGPAMLRSSGSGRLSHFTSCHHRRSHRRSQHAGGQQAAAKSSRQHWPGSPGLRGDRSRQLAEARSASGTWSPPRQQRRRSDSPAHDARKAAPIPTG